MKKIISTVLVLSLAVSAVSLASCGGKHVIDTDIAGNDADTVSGAAGYVYENVTDEKGENVTDAEGETVTVAVPAEEEGTTADASSEAATKKGEMTTKKTENTTKKGETTTKKTESATKKGETTTKKTETTTKKNETTTKKQETTTKKNETTTKKQEPTTAVITTSPPATNIKDGEYQMTLKADKTEVKPGETFTVTLNLKNCKNVQSFQIEMREEGSFKATNSKKNMSADSLSMEINTDPPAPSEGTLIGGYFSKSDNFDNYDLCTITYKVSADAEDGETLLVSAAATQMMVYAENSMGQDYSDAMKIPYIYVTVKK